MAKEDSNQSHRWTQSYSLLEHWRHPEAARRKRKLFAFGGTLSAFCLTVQCFREDGFFANRLTVATTASRTTDTEASLEAPSAFCEQLEAYLRHEEEAFGPAALEWVARTAGVEVDDGRIREIARHARLLESEAEATERQDWAIRAALYRVIGELYVCSARGNTMQLERAADAHVAAGDTLRAYGDSSAAQRRFKRAITVLRLAIDAAPAARSEVAARMRGKVATLESNIEVLQRRIDRAIESEPAK
jgi:hypothetical protein